MKTKQRDVRTASFAAIGCLLLTSTPSFAGDVLDQIRSDVRFESSVVDSPEAEEVRTASRRANNFFASELEDSLGRIFLYVVSSPFWLPPVMLRDDYHAESYFAQYPYAERFGREHHGYMLVDPQDVVALSRHSFRATAQYGTSFDDLSHWGGRIQFDSRVRLGLDVATKWLLEDNSTGNDELNVGDASLMFRFAQARRVQMRSGIGVNWLHDEFDTDWGFNFTYGADWFPDDPFVVSTHFDWGTLGDTNMFHYRISGGLLMGRTETFLGYDYLEIGDFENGSLIGGVRLWF